ncbi:hypothetical protein [Urbifossiella limnaea]|uniref:DUF1592 domain-containing protein n=1 Tax=Urbifossiella limnaea TaxID=2528023 RepID=A0A517XYV9_9BACT|nr:hypothetical protein [Urbifossiella limnaea]QDU22648.1 hypothetical protein ETAA1_46310 [Urbifossiella limnaea]
MLRLLPFILVAVTAVVGARGQDKSAPPKQVYDCAAAVDSFFADEVWAKVALPKCLTCHSAGGDAEESKLVLRDPRKLQGPARDDAMRHNRAAFAKMAAAKHKDQSRLLLKVVGELDHGGEDVLPADSAGYRVLQTFVKRVNTPVAPGDLTKIDPKAPPFFAGVVMLDDARLLRRVTLSLAGRLPTDAERAAVGKDGLKALPGLMDKLMTEDAFYLRLREGFNDIFLTLGVDGNADQTVLSYDHFPNRHWYQKHDLTKAGDEKAQTQARYKLAADYRKSLLEEPLRLVEHIVRTDKPFTEVVTADYVMQSPYTARGYGTFDEVKGRFKNADDPFEFTPVKLKALVGRERDKSQNQDSATGFYPHAGVLGSFQYLTRYPTTETNRNRLRARMYYQHFLGVDVLELAARVSDAAAAQAKYAVPTMQAAECVVCHKTLDPVAGLFQDYWRFADRGVYGKRKGGWFTDMFPAGFEGEDLPAAERWRALQWLGDRTAKDPRFAVAMTEHAYFILTGRKSLLPPKDLDDPLYPAKRRAYAEQRREVERISAAMVGHGFNLKVAFKEWAQSPFYRADGLQTATADPARRAELDDVGLVRMLSPEQTERKVFAVFGERWGRLTEQTAMLYGGIDSQEVTERATDPSGAMGAIQRILSNDVACRHVPKDFSRPANERKLFPFVDPQTKPGTSAASDAAIRKQVVYLHERILGRADAADVDRTVKLFAGVVADAAGKKGIEGRETYHCRREDATIPADPHYTIRAWRAVVTYLLRRPEFLYE